MGVGNMRRGLFYGKRFVIRQTSLQYCNIFFLHIDETDDEDDGLPKRKRRLAERAAEGMDMDDGQVPLVITCLKVRCL